MYESEQWRDIPGLEGRYQVSDHGSVRSVSRMHKGRAIRSTVKKLETHYKGYRYVKVWHYEPKPYVKKKYFVHRLVASAFLPNPDGKPIVNHRDRDKGNNHLSNLEWCTDSENQVHWREHEKSTERYSRGHDDHTFDDADLPF